MIILRRTLTVLAGLFVALGVISAQAQDAEITYNTHVAKIIGENCVVCHREGGIGPMQFTSYEQVRPWAPLIQLRVANREMPPYAYDHGIGIQNLDGDWRLEQEEIDTIVAWVNQGAPLGDVDITPPVADLPDPTQWTFAAQFGEPDMILPSIPIDIPATGNDIWLKHYVETGLTQDRCIKAVQVKPRGDAKAVVHHANTDILVPDEDGEYSQFGYLTEYAMGKWGEVMPEGVCRTLPENARVHWDIHMFPGGVGGAAEGEMIRDNVVEVGLWFHDEDFIAESQPYKQDLRPYLLMEGYQNNELIIPPNGYLMTQGFHSFDHPVRIERATAAGASIVRASYSVQPAEILTLVKRCGAMIPSVSDLKRTRATMRKIPIAKYSELKPLDPTCALLAGVGLVLNQGCQNRVP